MSIDNTRLLSDDFFKSSTPVRRWNLGLYDCCEYRDIKV
jgi:hypothetical protein